MRYRRSEEKYNGSFHLPSFYPVIDASASCFESVLFDCNFGDGTLGFRIGARSYGVCNLSRPKICKIGIKVDGSLRESVRTIGVFGCFSGFQIP
jgi:hypothetical protein